MSYTSSDPENSNRDLDSNSVASTSTCASQQSKTKKKPWSKFKSSLKSIKNKMSTKPSFEEPTVSSQLKKVKKNKKSRDNGNSSGDVNPSSSEEQLKEKSPLSKGPKSIIKKLSVETISTPFVGLQPVAVSPPKSFAKSGSTSESNLSTSDLDTPKKSSTLDKNTKYSFSTHGSPDSGRVSQVMEGSVSDSRPPSQITEEGYSSGPQKAASDLSVDSDSTSPQTFAKRPIFEEPAYGSLVAKTRQFAESLVPAKFEKETGVDVSVKLINAETMTESKPQLTASTITVKSKKKDGVEGSSKSIILGTKNVEFEQLSKSMESGKVLEAKPDLSIMTVDEVDRKKGPTKITDRAKIIDNASADFIRSEQAKSAKDTSVKMVTEQLKVSSNTKNPILDITQKKNESISAADTNQSVSKTKESTTKKTESKQTKDAKQLKKHEERPGLDSKQRRDEKAPILDIKQNISEAIENQPLKNEEKLIRKEEISVISPAQEKNKESALVEKIQSIPVKPASQSTTKSGEAPKSATKQKSNEEKSKLEKLEKKPELSGLPGLQLTKSEQKNESVIESETSSMKETKLLPKDSLTEHKPGNEKLFADIPGIKTSDQKEKSLQGDIATKFKINEIGVKIENKKDIKIDFKKETESTIRPTLTDHSKKSDKGELEPTPVPTKQSVSEKCNVEAISASTEDGQSVSKKDEVESTAVTTEDSQSASEKYSVPYTPPKILDLTVPAAGANPPSPSSEATLAVEEKLSAFLLTEGWSGTIKDSAVQSNVEGSQQPDKRECLYKILVIGELGTGKTSIIKRYVHQFFSQHYRATIGVDFALKVLNWDSNTIIRLQLWDIAGQERFGNMTRVYYKEAVGAFIVFDVTRSATFDAVLKWKQDLDSKVQLADGSPIPCVLLANKCDQQKEGIVNTPSKMEEYCKENNFSGWFETSAKENINIDDAAKSLVSQILQNDKMSQNGKDSNRDGSKFPLDGKPEQEGRSCSC